MSNAKRIRPSGASPEPDSGSVVGRLAPSPTGVLHLGNARSFMLAWLDVRSRQGHVVLRIEDLDGPRNKVGADLQAIEDLQWLGFDWDSGPFEQRSRLPVYRQILAELIRKGLAYPCTCTRKDVQLAATAPHASEEGPIYPGLCRGRWADAETALAETGRRPCWRFAVPVGSKITFEDRFMGTCQFQVDQQLGDFVIWKSDDEPAYQLAVVVDDAEQGINQVLRGDDLLPSAARQILLYQALGLPVPKFCHVPLLVGPDGRRLAKRHGDTSLRFFRQQGVAASQVLQWLAQVSGLAAGQSPQRVADLLIDSPLRRLPATPVCWKGEFF
jgi:glutamyl-tRNA synthetase